MTPVLTKLHSRPFFFLNPNTSKRSFRIGFLLLCGNLVCNFTFLASAQEKLGLVNSNYTPLVAMYANPAELVDGRREWDYLLSIYRNRSMKFTGEITTTASAP